MPDEPEPTTEELEARLQKLLGDPDGGSDEELDAIESKLFALENRFAEQQEERKEEDAFFDKEFDERLQKLNSKAEEVKSRRQEIKQETNRKQAIDSTSSRGLGFGLLLAYSMVGPLIAGWGIGWLVDMSMGKNNVWQTWGTVIGLFAGFISVVFLLNRTSDKK